MVEFLVHFLVKLQQAYIYVLHQKNQCSRQLLNNVLIDVEIREIRPTKRLVTNLLRKVMKMTILKNDKCNAVKIIREISMRKTA